ncbi:hypothetical protein SDC9_112811 [bioreactor metagenome]|uniref:Uncharacterized protein n=1 Tax=bioreactor metagenome TaxID=1076179 RepID=A0A645BKS2_9ZZZZ
MTRVAIVVPPEVVEMDSGEGFFSVVVDDQYADLSLKALSSLINSGSLTMG